MDGIEGGFLGIPFGHFTPEVVVMMSIELPSVFSPRLSLLPRPFFVGLATFSSPGVLTDCSEFKWEGLEVGAFLLPWVGHPVPCNCSSYLGVKNSTILSSSLICGVDFDTRISALALHVKVH